MLYCYRQQLPDKPEDGVSLLASNPNFIKIEFIVSTIKHYYINFLPRRGIIATWAVPIYKNDFKLVVCASSTSISGEYSRWYG